jgi:hypothetical protein
MHKGALFPPWAIQYVLSYKANGIFDGPFLNYITEGIEKYLILRQVHGLFSMTSWSACNVSVKILWVNSFSLLAVLLRIIDFTSGLEHRMTDFMVIIYLNHTHFNVNGFFLYPLPG